MAREIEFDENVHFVGLYDSATGEACVAEKLMDVTDDCPGADEDKRAVLLFTRAKRGRIVQVVRPDPGEEGMGTYIHFFVDEIGREMRAAPRDDTFGSTAERLGLSKEALRTLIEKHAPA